MNPIESMFETMMQCPLRCCFDEYFRIEKYSDYNVGKYDMKFSTVDIHILFFKCVSIIHAQKKPERISTQCLR